MRGTLEENWSILQNMKFSSKLNISNAGFICYAPLRCLNCARKSMTNSASFGEMHCTLVSFVRYGVCTQKLGPKNRKRVVYFVKNKKEKKKEREKERKKKQQFSACTPVIHVDYFAIY